MARHKITSGKKKVSGKKARKSPRRRRVSGGGKIQTVAMNGLAVGAGAVAAREISILAGHFFPQLQASPVMTGVVQVLAGGLLAWKAPNGFLMYGGLGILGNGVVTVLNGSGVIGAPNTMSYDFVNRRRMGDPRLQFVAGPQTRIGSNSFANNFSLVAGPGRKRVNRYVS